MTLLRRFILSEQFTLASLYCLFLSIGISFKPVYGVASKSTTNSGLIVSNKDSVTTQEDFSVEVNVLANDQNNTGFNLSVSYTSMPHHGAIEKTGDSVLVYTPNSNFSGLDSIQYVAQAGSIFQDSAWLYITVLNSNDKPVAVNDSVSVAEDNEVTFNPLNNDYDIDEDSLYISSFSEPLNGTLSNSASLDWIYSPDLNFNGTDSLYYILSDEAHDIDTAWVFFNISSINDIPEALNDTFLIEEDQTLILDILKNDKDADGDVLTIDAVNAPAHGTIDKLEVGNWLYMPNDNYHGTDSLSYKVIDASGAVDSAWVYIDILALNDAPVAVQDAFETVEDSLLFLNVLSNDLDADGDSIFISYVSNPSYGTLYYVDSANIWCYEPNTDYFGSDDFFYKVSDLHGAVDSAGVQLLINAKNDAPVITEDTLGLPEDSLIYFSLLERVEDVDDTDLIIDTFSQPKNGNIDQIENDQFLYTPFENYCGADSILFKVKDASNAFSEAYLFFKVTPVNDVPISVDDTVSLNEDGSLLVDVLSNDFDIEDDALDIVEVNQPQHGEVIIDENKLRYTPFANFSGSDSFNYSISDGFSDPVPAMVMVEVLAENDTPIATNDTVTLQEDQEQLIEVLLNDIDPEGGLLSITNVTIPQHGQAAISQNKESISYLPTPDYNGEDQFEYSVRDEEGLSVTATVFLAVVAVNDAPIAVADSITISEDSEVIIQVLENDSDIEGDELNIVATGQPGHGEVTIEENNLHYIPFTDYNGTDIFNYSITDGSSEPVTATVTVEVLAENDFPIAVNDTISLQEDQEQLIQAILNDVDPEGGLLSITSLTVPQYGEAAISENRESISYLPAPDFNGNDQFEYTVRDEEGLSVTATVFLTVAEVNDAPFAVDDTVSMDEDSEVVIQVLSNDYDIERDELQIVDVRANVATDIHFSPFSITYNAPENYTGKDTLEYVIEDGMLQASAKVFITIRAVNDPPRALDDAISSYEDTPVEIQVLSNDFDPENEQLSITNINEPANGTLNWIQGQSTVIYNPNDNFNGEDTFIYTIADESGGSASARVIVSVTPVNDAPVAVNDTLSMDEDEVISINALANDYDVEADELQIVDVKSWSKADISFNSATISYRPEANFSGTDSIEYEIEDVNGLRANAKVYLTLNAVNDVPVALIDELSTYEDTPVEINVLSNDSDPENEELTVSIIREPINGQSSIIEGNQIYYVPNTNYHGADSLVYRITDPHGAQSEAKVIITAIMPVNDSPEAINDYVSVDEDHSVEIPLMDNDFDVDGDQLELEAYSQTLNGVIELNESNSTLRYIPKADYYGTDSLTYSIIDPTGFSSEATVYIDVSPVNDAPQAFAERITVMEDTPSMVDILQNDVDVDGDELVVIEFDQPFNGRAKLEDGQMVYEPDNNFTGSDSIKYTIGDGNGEAATTWLVIQQIIPVNDFPVAIDDVAETMEDTEVIVSILDNDFDVDQDSIQITSVSQPVNGHSEIENSYSVKYTPKPDYNGSDRFSYTISDGQEFVTAWVEIRTIHPVNDAPVARDDFATTEEDKRVKVYVMNNDSDADGDAFEVIDVGGAVHGQTNIKNDEYIRYSPNDDYSGLDDFWYVISDGEATDTAWVTVFIGEINDAPVAVNDTVVGAEDTHFVVNVLENDEDSDGDPLTVIEITDPFNGTAIFNSQGTVIYTVKQHFFGKDSLQYTVFDQNGNLTTGWLFFIVEPVNDVPIAVLDYKTGIEDSLLQINVLQNDLDIDGDSLSITDFGQAGHGLVYQNGHILYYEPHPDFHGSDSVWYQISDGTITSEAMIYLTIQPWNDFPIANDDQFSVQEDQTSMLEVLANDEDIDGDELEIRIETQPSKGEAFLTQGELYYIPILDFVGSDSLTYTIYDNQGGYSTAIVRIEVIEQNDSPNAKNDLVSVQEDEVAIVDLLANDFDPESELLLVTDFSQPLNGTAQISEGILTYTPNLNYFGSDSLYYIIEDVEGLQDTAKVFFEVNPVNDPPVAVPDTFLVNEDVTATMDPLQNDIDVDGDALNLHHISGGTNGTILIEQNQIIYHPGLNYTGYDTIQYSIVDEFGTISSSVIYLEIINTNDPPVGQVDRYELLEDEQKWLHVLLNDSDNESESLSIVFEEHTQNAEITLREDSLLYQPVPDFYGEDSLAYVVSDGELTDTVNVYLTVLPVNDLPVAQNDTVFVNKNDSLVFNPMDNDYDLDRDELTLLNVQMSANGFTEWNESGEVKYIPAQGFSGTDQIIYTISDGELTATASILLFVRNTAPVASDDYDSLLEDQSKLIDVLQNDFDEDGESLQISWLEELSDAIIRIQDEQVFVQPEKDFNGALVFKYAVQDQSGIIDTATVYLYIEPINDAPVAESASLSTNEEELIEIDLTDFIQDIDNNVSELEVSWLGVASNGTLEIIEKATVSYQPVKDFNGEDRFSFIVTDGNLISDTAQVLLTVWQVNDPPVAYNDTVRGSEDQIIRIDVLYNDVDIDENILSILSFTEPEHGYVVVNADKSFTYSPNPDFFGSDYFSYTVIDEEGLKATALVIIDEIVPVNDPPIAIADTFYINEFESLSGNLLANDRDPEGDQLRLIQVNDPESGNINWSGNGNFTYEPAVNQQKNKLQFSYQIVDDGTSPKTAQGIVTLLFEIKLQVADRKISENGQLDIPLDSAGYYLSEVLSPPENGELLISSDSTNIYYIPEVNFTGTDHFNLKVCNNEGGCIKLNVNVEVIPVTELIIYEYISPNGDGKNDHWTIEGIQHFPNSTVSIFNLEGQLIYQEVDYDNINKAWNGNIEKGLVVGNGEAPAGTYFYSIDLGNGEVKQGSILLIR